MAVPPTPIVFVPPETVMVKVAVLLADISTRAEKNKMHALPPFFIAEGFNVVELIVLDVATIAIPADG